MQMTRNELIGMCSNYYIASGELVFDMRFRKTMCIATPAATGVDNTHLEPRTEEDDGKLNVTFFGADGLNALTTHSRYAKGDYVYVREAYYKKDGEVHYKADNGYDAYQNREKVISARYMPKSLARIFFLVEVVKLRRIKDIRLDEIKRFGFANFTPFFNAYDASLSEREWEYSRSELNPYVFIYEVRMVVPDELQCKIDLSTHSVDWYKEHGFSASDMFDEMVRRERERRAAAEIAKIREIAKTEPAFGRMLDLVLEREKDNA